MTYSIYTQEMLALCGWLKAERERSTLSMRGLADLLGKPHSYVQKVEQGERRLDVVEYVWYCQALGSDPTIGLQLIAQQVSSTSTLAN